MENKVDNLFQQGLEGHMMVPGRDIWAEIEAAQKKKKKKRFIIFFVLFLAAGMAAAGIYQFGRQKDLIVSSESPATQKTQEIDKESENVSDGTQNQAGSNAAGEATDQADEGENNAVAKEKRGENAADPAMKSNIEFPATLPSAKEKKQNAGTNVNLQPDHSAGKSSAKKNQKGTKVSTSAVKGNDKIKDETVEGGAAKTKEQPAVAVSPDNPEKAEAKDAITAKSEKTSGDQAVETVIDAAKVNPVADSVLKSDENTVATVMPVIAKDSATASAGNSTDIKSDSAKSKFFIFALAGPAYNKRSLSDRDGSGKALMDARNEAESGIRSLHYLVSAGYNLNRHLDLNLGIAYIRSGMNSTFSYKETTIERVADKKRKKASKGPGIALYDDWDSIDVIKETTYTVDEQARYTFIKLPLSISFQITKGRSAFSLGLGGAPGYLLKASGNMYTADSLSVSPYSIPVNDLPLKKWNMEAMACAGYELTISKSIALMLQPTINYSLTGLFDSTYPLLQRNYSLSLLTGIKYHF